MSITKAAEDVYDTFANNSTETNVAIAAGTVAAVIFAAPVLTVAGAGLGAYWASKWLSSEEEPQGEQAQA